uniref:NADH-ubiquinone oxidoreductase chain 4L n=1 Tax=Tricholepidion gertschi TaxID=89825 RepID=Q85QR8_9INSE|nr:NADH dehydrogenase subunit 4L [Tricholepidion gertschi]AAO40221.1 NADH dehydrogenase subunit 4L [Tricholepidion gertschi]
MMTYFPYFLVSSFMIFGGFWVFVSSHKHLLIVLLSLEYMMLGLYLCLVFFLASLDIEVYFSMIFIIFCVCEGSLGLSILVSMVRSHGNDYFSSYTILQC